MMVSISPKYAVAPVVGYIKGESAIYIARTYVVEREKRMVEKRGSIFGLEATYFSRIGMGIMGLRWATVKRKSPCLVGFWFWLDGAE